MTANSSRKKPDRYQCQPDARVGSGEVETFGLDCPPSYSPWRVWLIAARIRGLLGYIPYGV